MYKITRLLGFCVVYLLVVVLQAKAEQDYFRLRNNPDLQILLDNKQVLVDLKSIHTQLALKANEARVSFEKKGIIEERKQNLKTLGNFAIGQLSFVFDDKNIVHSAHYS